jgi:DNA-directed RNA polymerase subunit RPC12/RpoP
MSASQRPGKNSPDTTRDDAPPDIDAYAISIPQAFIEGFEGDTIPEKLRAAERAPSTTGASERGACERCGSVRVHKKTGFDSQHEVDRPYRCTNCGAHIEELVPPAIGARDSAQAGLEVWSDE